jgi:two-component system NarL family sensor kinase
MPRIEIPRPAKIALAYALAIVVPIAIAQITPNELKISPFFLWIAICARFFGFGPAIASALSSAVNLWEIILPQDAYPMRVQLLRLGLFVIAAVVVSSVSRQRSKEAREADERYRTLVELAPDGILVTDEAGKIVFANSALARILGAHDAASLIGRNALDFVQPVEHELTRHRIEQLVSGQPTPWVVTQAIRLDGSAVQVERTGIPLRKGNKLFAQEFVRDLTERKEAERAIQQLSVRLMRSQDEERRRIARQLHDTIAQNLTAIRLNLARINGSPAAAVAEFAEPLTESMSLADEVISEIRTLSYLLHPPLIDEVGLSGSLRWYAQGFEARSGIKVSLDIAEDLRLPRDIETTVFRIVQEALTNIQRHSGSSVARISIVGQPSGIRLTVRDEGRGIAARLRADPEALFASGVGIAGIRERARELGGDVQIESTDRGTTVIVTFPVPEA